VTEDMSGFEVRRSQHDPTLSYRVQLHYSPLKKVAFFVTMRERSPGVSQATCILFTEYTLQITL